MTVRQFLDLVEIKVVIPSLAPLLVGLAYSQWRYHLVNWGNTILLIIAAVSVHLAVNTFNRYEDHKRQVSSQYLRETSAKKDLTDHCVLIVAVILGLLAALAGILVAWRTSYVTWIIGILSFLIGYFYSAGPRPITNTPLGEFVSGITMGYFIFVAQVYVNTMIVLSPMILLQWFFVSLPLVLLIANIMLANNIADHEEDEENQRHTIVHYLGLANAKKLYFSWVILAYTEIVVVVICGWLPLTALATWALTPLVWRNTQRFVDNPIKSKNFVLAIQNLVILMVTMAISIIIGFWL